MDKLLTTKDVAKILGISEVTAKIWASKRKFPVVKVGRLIRVSPKALQGWIDKNNVVSREDASGYEEKKSEKRDSYGSFDKYVQKLKSEEKG